MAVKEAVQVLVDFGLLDVVLPFVAVFAIVYATLERTKVLGRDGSRYNSIVAFVLGFFVVAAFELVNILQSVMQWSALAIIALVLVAIVRHALGGVESLSAKEYPKIVCFLIMAAIALYALGFRNWISISLVENVLIPLFIIVAVIGGVMYLILKGERRVEPEPAKAAVPSDESEESSPAAAARGPQRRVPSKKEMDEFIRRLVEREQER